MVNETESTARTRLIDQPSAPRRSGKCLVRRDTSRRGIPVPTAPPSDRGMQPAAAHLPAPHRELGGLLGAAALHDVWATRREGASSRKPGQVGGLALDGGEA